MAVMGAVKNLPTSNGSAHGVLMLKRQKAARESMSQEYPSSGKTGWLILWRQLVIVCNNW